MATLSGGPVLPLLLLLLLDHVVVLGGQHVCGPTMAARVRRTLGDITTASSCPDAVWKPLFQASKTIQNLRRPVIIFDIGCNKGFDALNSLRLFTQSARFDVSRWARETRFRCGVCGQCQKNARLDPRTLPKNVSLHCIEPLPVNYERVRAASQMLQYDKHGMTVVHAAFTNRTDAVARHWRAAFPVIRGWRAKLPTSWKLEGAEQVGIDVDPLCPDCEHEDVPLMVLDSYVRENGIRDIEILSIDTEGNDALVLSGGLETLNARVRYLEFEYGTTGAWERIRLPPVIQTLERKGFVCYWLGKGKLWRITDCWHPDYATVKVWANIGCVHRREIEWIGIMEEIFIKSAHL